MKKHSVLIGILMVFMFSSATFAANFGDVKTSAWYYTAVNTMADHGIIAGYDNGTFQPDRKISRAEFVSLLAKSSGENYSGCSANYADVKTTEWSSPAIGWATEKGIVSGTGNRKFSPNETITRQDITCMVHRYLNHKGVALPVALTLYYADANAVSSYARDSVGVILAYGGINGVGDNKFSPKGKASRAEASQLLFNNTFRNARQRCAFFARNFEGFPYTTGGASPASGFDNIGFVAYVYNQFGVTLSGDAISLREVGTAVSYSGLNMGDLVCFDGTTPLVGIYLGDGKIALSLKAKNTTSGVYITTITSGYYKNNFITGRRLFSA